MAHPTVVSFAAAVLAVASLFMTVDGTYISIQNNLPGRVRIHCWSDVENFPYHDSAPGATYRYGFTDDKQSSWTCNISGPDSYSGTFLMWRSRGPPCFNVYGCPWIADDNGLSLIRYDGYVEHIYHWP